MEHFAGILDADSPRRPHSVATFIFFSYLLSGLDCWFFLLAWIRCTTRVFTLAVTKICWKVYTVARSTPSRAGEDKEEYGVRATAGHNRCWLRSEKGVTEESPVAPTNAHRSIPSKYGRADALRSLYGELAAGWPAIRLAGGYTSAVRGMNWPLSRDTSMYRTIRATLFINTLLTLGSLARSLLSCRSPSRTSDDMASCRWIDRPGNPYTTTRTNPCTYQCTLARKPLFIQHSTAVQIMFIIEKIK